MENCHCNTAQITDGSNQWQRYLKALDPDYVKIDKRSIQDLLVYAKEYAKQVKFCELSEEEGNNSNDSNDNSWHEFFNRDLATITASIAVYDLSSIMKEYDDIRQELEKHPDSAVYSALYGPLMNMIEQIDRWYSICVPGYPLHEDLHLAIVSNLSLSLKRIAEYEEGFKLIDSKNPLNINYDGIKNDALWGLDSDIEPDLLIYEGEDKEEKILNAALYTDEIFNTLYGFLNQLINNSNDYFQFALKEFPNHQPHMALFIAFLELFNLVQNQTNELTERMLNFYYRDVLHLTEKGSIPDRAHLVIELAKEISEYELVEGTRFKGGKDSLGVEQIYQIKETFVANQTIVKRLQTTFVDKSEVVPEISPATRAEVSERRELVHGIYARPVANSKDGFGAEFEDEKPLWPTFGWGPVQEKNPNSICDQIDLIKEKESREDRAAVGFAIASPELVLQGGNRMIEWNQDGFSALAESSLDNIEVSLTGEEGWLKINKIEGDEFATKSTYHIEENVLRIHLPASEQAIVAYTSELHDGPVYNTAFPVIRVMIKDPSAILYRNTFVNTSLRVRVGTINPSTPNNTALGDANMDGLRHLVLQNDDGLIDSSKSFHPFTAYPGRGKSLYIGSEEIFNKKITRLSINVIDNNSGELNSQNDVHVLENRVWTELPQTFNRSYLTTDILSHKPSVEGDNGLVKIIRRPVADVSEYKNGTYKGFIRIDNRTDVVGNDNMGYYQRSQELAPNLEIKELSISYESQLDHLENEIDQVFHVYPHGATEISISNRWSPETPEPLVVDAGRLLFPQFTHLDLYKEYDTDEGMEREESTGEIEITRPYRRLPNGSELFMSKFKVDSLSKMANQYMADYQEEGMLSIGLENAKPLQTVSILFQFAEGSAEDIDHDPPPIHWSYLSNNRWQPLSGEQIISDNTYGFQTTGIIKIEIPENATTNNTLRERGLIWLQASVYEYSNRIPQLVDVTTQAVLAEFVDQENDPSHFDCALEAGSIAKLDVNVAEVKSINQPFASFDGKHAEVGKEFYTRVSERLRHKGRAITSWDYEHLVLNRFPEIHKIKCIPHTDPNCLCREKEHRLDEEIINDNQRGLSECCGPQTAPGHVLLVPIANLKNRNATNPLQPKTGRRTLLEIEKYIKKRTSPFVKVHARNPVYEQVIVSFKVKFYSGVDKGYHLKKLNSEIVRYLTPWAFDDTVDVSFGQKIYASSIINFIEERPYVDFITDFLMGICYDNCCPEKQTNEHEEADLNDIKSCDDIERFLHGTSEFRGEVIAKSCNPRAILVSAPEHIIMPFIEPEHLSPCEERKNRKIEYRNRVGNLSRRFDRLEVSFNLEHLALTEERNRPLDLKEVEVEKKASIKPKAKKRTSPRRVTQKKERTNKKTQPTDRRKVASKTNPSVKTATKNKTTRAAKKTTPKPLTSEKKNTSVKGSNKKEEN